MTDSDYMHSETFLGWDGIDCWYWCRHRSRLAARDWYMVNLHIFSFFHLPHCGSQCKSSSLPRKVLMFWTTPMWTNVIWKYWGVIWTNPKDTEGYQQDFMKRVAAHATYLPGWVCKYVFGLLPLWYLDIFWTIPLEFWTIPIGLTNQKLRLIPWDTCWAFL